MSVLNTTHTVVWYGEWESSHGPELSTATWLRSNVLCDVRWVSPTGVHLKRLWRRRKSKLVVLDSKSFRTHKPSVSWLQDLAGAYISMVDTNRTTLWTSLTTTESESDSYDQDSNHIKTAKQTPFRKQVQTSGTLRNSHIWAAMTQVLCVFFIFVLHRTMHLPTDWWIRWKFGSAGAIPPALPTVSSLVHGSLSVCVLTQPTRLFMYSKPVHAKPQAAILKYDKVSTMYWTHKHQQGCILIFSVWIVNSKKPGYVN